jgi:hypothetical protein
VLDPRRVAVSLAGALPGVRCVLGEVGRDDLAHRGVEVRSLGGQTSALGDDRLVVAAGSVNKLLPIPGLPSTRTDSEASPRHSACATTSPVRSSWRTRPTTTGARAPVHLRSGGRGLHRYRGGRAGRVDDGRTGQDPSPAALDSHQADQRASSAGKRDQRELLEPMRR